MHTLKIGQVAHETGLSTETIRYYERQGIMPKPARLPNGYRGYAPAAVARLNFVKRAKRLGFSLREIRDLLSLLGDENAGAKDIKLRAEAKLLEIERSIADLEKMRRALHELTNACPGSGVKDRCPIYIALVDDTDPVR